MNSESAPTLEHTAREESRRILVIDDELLFAKAIQRHLEREGFECSLVASLAEGKAMMRSLRPQVVLLDMRLPDGSGLDFLKYCLDEQFADVAVIVITAYGEIADAVSAMKLSASDYLKKPIDLDELNLCIERVLARREISARLAFSRAREARAKDQPILIGESDSSQENRRQIQRIADRIAKSNAPPPTVFITGETGTGKDVNARLLHQASRLCDEPFVHIDCASLPHDLVEAELFGHCKGAFTNAQTDRAGLIEIAERGVVFFDEITELPVAMQAKLLAVLERRRLRRVGSNRERSTDAWFIAATNRDATAMVADGALRADLFFRLNVLNLHLAPLRERDGDVELLAAAFIDEFARRYGVGETRLTSDARRCLAAYHWPGNIRELRHVLESAVVVGGGGAIGADHLMLLSNKRDPDTSSDLDHLTLEDAERRLIIAALERCANNVSAAARELGVSRMAMRYRMKKYDLD